MYQIERKIFLLAIILIICGVSNAAVYTVGDSKGWTSTSVTHVDYRSWASSKDFHVGDTILFVYVKQFHNVVQVTYENFNKCNGTSPIETWTSGNDSFIIHNSGHYFFISNLLHAQCEDGQKVDIRVPNETPPPSPPATPPASVDVAPPAQPQPKSDAARLWATIELLFVACSLSFFRF